MSAERTHSAEETKAWGAALARDTVAGSVIALCGDLGAGKTTLVQGFADGWGVSDLTQVVSPSYTMLNEYPSARGPLWHLDFYRLEDAGALRRLGIDEFLLRDDGVAIVEWADRHRQSLPAHARWLQLARTGSGYHTYHFSAARKS